MARRAELAQTPRRRGLTLIELTLSSAAAAILLGALTSAVLLVSRALPGDSRELDRTTPAASLCEQIGTELLGSWYLAERGPNAVTFTVADRNNDGSPERIRYAWSGVAGAPLTRQYNGGAAVTVLEDVQYFSLGYTLKAVVEQYPGAPLECAETTLASYTSSTSLGDLQVKAGQGWGEWFTPTLPNDALSWKVTRVGFQAKRDGAADGTTTVQLRVTDYYGLPSTLVDTATLAESSLTDAYQWIYRSFSSAGGLLPSQTLCLTFTSSDINPTLRLRHRTIGGQHTGAYMLEARPDWTYIYYDKSVLYQIFGTYSQPAPPQTATRQYVTGVQLGLQAGADAATRVESTIHLLNRPEVLAGLWQLDFSAVPTAVDFNADGLADWSRVDGQPFDAAGLAGGIWTASTTLRTQPDQTFTTLTTAEVRLRCTGTAGSGATFGINVDEADGLRGPLVATLRLQADGTQTLTLFRKSDEATRVALATVAGLAAGLVDLRLLIDPALDTVNLKVNGTDYKTHRYTRFAPAASEPYAWLSNGGSPAEFDFVRLRVGGGSG